jgi:putative uncharacterized protein (fragment)
MKELNHRVAIRENVLEGEARELLSHFFSSMRVKKKES